MALQMSQLWDVFSGNNSDSMEKVAGLTEDFLRDRIRETSVLNRALPPVVLTEAQIERNTANDWPLKRVEIEPNSKAFTIGFRGKGTAQFFEGRKYEVYFTKIETEHFKKTREELMTMRYPVMDVVNNNFVLDMQEQLDGMFVTRLDAAAAAQAATNIISTGAGTVKDLFKNAVLAGVRAILGRRRRAARLIMTESTWLNLAKLEPDKIGYEPVSRIAFGGVANEKTFLGYEVITSINSTTAGSVWNDDYIYCIAEPGFLGSNFILGDVRQEMKREGNMLEWWAWADQGTEIGNISSVSKITGISSLT
jgi:hypothetical protein